MTSTSGYENDLKPLAGEILGAFAAIADAAGADLARRGVSLDDLAFVNQATAEATAARMRGMNEGRFDTDQRLRREPAIARLVIADEDGAQETLYITNSGTVEQDAVKLCSYMSAKGRLASFPVGEDREVPLPGGSRWFQVLDKITFRPSDADGEWDARPAVSYREGHFPRTIRSLRELLRDDGYTHEQADAIAAWLSNDGADDGNIVDGIRRDALTAMGLRVAPILDEFQDRIFRLPIDRRIAVLGPPGSGKTTTLVKRLRQKVDFAHLEPEERALVEAADDAGLAHADSWLMFSPTELLRLYVNDAFGKAGVPVHDARLRVWDDYRREIGRGTLRILRSGRGSGFVLSTHDELLAPETASDQIAWFEAFDAFQQQRFVDQLRAEAERLSAATDPAAAALGRQASAAIERSGDRPIQLLGELASLRERLQRVTSARRDETRASLREPLRGFHREQPDFLAALTSFVDALGSDDGDDADDEDDDGEEEVVELPPTLRGAKLADDVFVRAMRARATAQASQRSVAANSRSGRLLAWLQRRGLTLPDLRQVGAGLLVQRAAARLLRAPNDYVRRVPLRYRLFRRAMRESGQWYGPARTAEAHPLEIDIIILAMLRAAGAIERDRLLMQRIAERRPAILDDIASLRRHQILVDEATDFSPIQLACMGELAHHRTGSLFLSGDFNQRLTTTGVRSEADLRWAAPDLDIERIDVTYRQTRELADFARSLALGQGYECRDRAPADIVNVGWKPALGLAIDDLRKQAAWLGGRIRNIIELTNGAMPTIAVLMADSADLDALADALSEDIADTNVRAVACPRGQVKGQAGDVRLFEVEHIKGLEFEAVFLIDIDRMREVQPDLFGRYLYVGATRAATFLGVSSRQQALPPELAPLAASFGDAW